MQVVADGVPNRLMDMPTERIVDRRQRSERRTSSERRKPRLELEAPVEAPVDPWPTRTPGWNRVIVVSLATFVFGVLVTVTVDQLTRHARAKTITPSAPAAVAPPNAAPANAPQAAAPAAVIVQPLPQPVAEPVALPAAVPAPAAAPALSSPIDLRPRKLRAVAKSPVARPRPPAAAKATPTTEVKAIERPPARPARAKWVDPFAD